MIRGLLVVIAAADSGLGVLTPLLLRAIIDDGIIRHREGVVVALSLAVAGLGLADALMTYAK
jgi:ATP-binding cassette, subfamily B, bacterial